MARAELAEYYQRRAPHYDAVYDKPERQQDLAQLKTMLPPIFADRDVLEIAAGTGYWTQVIAGSARSVFATDYNEAPLKIAATRAYPRDNTRFGHADAYHLDNVAGEFNAAFVGFWWSHMLVRDTDRFLHALCARLGPGSPVAIVDNRYVEGSNHPITRVDEAGNAYQRRALADGSEHDVLKNFPSSDALRAAVAGYAAADVVELDYYWLLTFTTESQTQ